MFRYQLEHDPLGIRVKNVYQDGSFRLPLDYSYCLSHNISSVNSLSISMQDHCITNAPSYSVTLPNCYQPVLTNVVENCGTNLSGQVILDITTTDAQDVVDFSQVEATLVRRNTDLDLISSQTLNLTGNGETSYILTLEPNDIYEVIIIYTSPCNVTHEYKMVIFPPREDNDSLTCDRIYIPSSFEMKITNRGTFAGIIFEDEDIIITPAFMTLDTFGSNVYHITFEINNSSRWEVCFFYDTDYELQCKIYGEIIDKLKCELIECEDLECVIKYETLRRIHECNRCEDTCELLECVIACAEGDKCAC